jgi:hypothetical protein
LLPMYFRHGWRPFLVDLRAPSGRRHLVLFLVVVLAAALIFVVYHFLFPLVVIIILSSSMIVNHGRSAISTKGETR